MHSFPVLMGKRGGVRSIPWYLTGGIVAANCVGAYQPKGAVDIAASKVNVANPGTHDCTEHGSYAFHAWDAVNGWKNTDSGQYVAVTDIVPATGWSLIMRYSEYTCAGGNSFDVGAFTSWGATIALGLAAGGASHRYMNGQYVDVAGVNAAGVLCVAGQQGYFNGSPDGGAIDVWSGTNTCVFQIGLIVGLETYNADTLYIQAVAIYNTVLSAAQVAALSAAMAAL